MDCSVRNYKRASGRLLQDVIRADQNRVYLTVGYSSLFSFLTRHYGLSEAITNDFIRVGRLAQEIPEVATAVRHQNASVHKLRKVAPVMTRENASEWIQKTRTQTARELEKEVAGLRPEATRKSFLKPLGKGNHRISVDTGEEVSQKLERAMEITGKPLEETLETMMDFYLKHHCPLKKAKRRVEKLVKPMQEAPVTEQEGNPKSKTSVTGQILRKPIPAEVKHAVHLRDQGQCAFHFKGKRCEGRRFLQIHHKIPVSKGGKNTLENLMTLCSSHHSLVHELSRE